MENIYTDGMKELLMSRSDLAAFRDKDTLYVDKTNYAYLLAQSKKGFYFISRPRRFGKSLFCSTLASLFEGRRDLFEGLYIAEKTDYDFRKYPVLRFDFSGMMLLDTESFLNGFRKDIAQAAMPYGIDVDMNDDPATMLNNVINRLYREYGECVIIIDEYDNPLSTAAMNKSPIVNDIHSILNSFYQTVKKNSSRIRFLFITGLVKLSHLSIFSAMNNLVDLTMDKSFAGAFGYTDDELDEYFSEGIDEYLEANPGKYESRAEFREMIKECYDGYRFSPDSDMTVYNPVSIGFFFRNKCVFDYYWEETGLSTLANTLARNCDLSAIAYGNIIVTKSAFRNFDIIQAPLDDMPDDSIAALLYFSGYLTIRDYDFPDITMAFPNTEVASSFTDNLLKLYAKRNSRFDSWAKNFYNACSSGDNETVRAKLTEYFDAFSYELIGDEKEKFFHAIFHAVFILAGVYAITEDRGLLGRADEVIIASDFLWIFELKVDGSADDALRQIEEKGYAKKYASMIAQYNLKVRKVGISFSSATKSIAEWKCINDSK